MLKKQTGAESIFFNQPDPQHLGGGAGFRIQLKPSRKTQIDRLENRESDPRKTSVTSVLGRLRDLQ